MYPLTNHIYRITVSSTTNIVLPASVDSTKDNQIIIYLTTSGTPNISLGTVHGWGTAPSAITVDNTYKLIYDYDGSNWVLEVKSLS